MMGFERGMEIPIYYDPFDFKLITLETRSRRSLGLRMLKSHEGL